MFCTLRRAGSDDIKLGSEGRFEIELDTTAVLGLFCTNEDRLEGPSEHRYIRVQPLPTEELGSPIKKVTMGAPEKKTIAAHGNGTQLQFIEVTLKVSSWLQAHAVTDGMRSDLSIWLVHDSNDDGRLQDSEVIDYQLVGPEVEAKDRLQAGTYTVIVVQRSLTNDFSLTLQTKPN